MRKVDDGEKRGKITEIVATKVNASWLPEWGNFPLERVQHPGFSWDNYNSPVYSKGVHTAAPKEARQPKNNTYLLSNPIMNFPANNTHCQEKSRNIGMRVDIALTTILHLKIKSIMGTQFKKNWDLT